MTRFGFIILHYGDPEVTFRCIDSILGLNTFKKDDSEASDQCFVVIVDNDSHKSDEERNILSEKYTGYENIDFLRIYDKTGFSHANNLGFKRLMEKFSPDFTVVANNDITFEQSGFFELCKKSHDKHKWTVLSPDVFSTDKKQHQSPIAFKGREKKELDFTIKMNEMSLMTFPLTWRAVSRTLEGYGNDSFLQKIKFDIVPCGACIIFASDFTDRETDIFMPETDFYYEEYILHERCRRAGYSIMYDPSIQVLHADGVSTKGRTLDEKERLKFLLKNTARSARIYRKFMYNR